MWGQLPSEQDATARIGTLLAEEKPSALSPSPAARWPSAAAEGAARARGDEFHRPGERLGAPQAQQQGAGGVIGSAGRTSRNCGSNSSRVTRRSAPEMTNTAGSGDRDATSGDRGHPGCPWKDEMKKEIYLDGVKAAISAGSVAGNVITLRLGVPSDAKVIGYISGRDWDGKPTNLIYGANGIAALTFCDVPIGAAFTR